jgi:hypothetical protein
MTEGFGGTEIRKTIFNLTMLWFLHWFITRSGVILGLWKTMYLEVEIQKFVTVRIGFLVCTHIRKPVSYKVWTNVHQRSLLTK